MKPTQLSVEIGKTIKELRERKGLSQTDFGKLFHLSQNDVTHIEHGTRAITYERLIAFSNYFGVTIDWLLKTQKITKEEFKCSDTATVSGADIKEAIKDAGLKLWQVAYVYGVNDGNFSRMLRKDFSELEAKQIFSIIEELKQA